MGVIFAAADDVAELLVPFVTSSGGLQDPREIEAAYVAASLGDIDADAFWRRVGLPPDVETVYLQSHTLRAGALEFIARAHASGFSVWCLSNDIGRWSKRLRHSLGVDRYLAGAVISSDVQARKPDREIYERLLEATGHRAEELLFIDDRANNVAAAAALDIRAVQFNPKHGFSELAQALFRD
jgi:HAD superfamily hydrolase (TIGR01509 family)